MKSKIEFIADILRDKRINDKMRKKVVDIAFSEIKITDTEIYRKERQVKEDLPHYIDPSELSKFLLAFNQDPVLKYTCHEIDDFEILEILKKMSGANEYNLTDHQKLISEAFYNLSKKYKVNSRIWALINNYLNGDGDWSSEKIKINWKCEEISEWSKLNPGIPPNPGINLINKTKNRGFIFNSIIKSNITGEKINSFSKLVIHFKHLFHLKGDFSLYDLIMQINSTKKWEGKIHFEMDKNDFWDNLELFTDVDKLIQAYKAIINIILDVVNENKMQIAIVKLSFQEDYTQNIVFLIHHKNSVYKKTIRNTKERIGESHTKLIKNQLNGLCDFFVKADFGHKQYAVINLWNGKKREETMLDQFEGVQFILKFAK